MVREHVGTKELGSGHGDRLILRVGWNGENVLKNLESENIKSLSY